MRPIVVCKAGIWGKGRDWLFLIIRLIIFLLILRYLIRKYPGEKTAPELNNVGGMVIDGLRLQVVSVIYALPIILLVIAAFRPFVSALVSSGTIYTYFTLMSLETRALICAPSRPGDGISERRCIFLDFFPNLTLW